TNDNRKQGYAATMQHDNLLEDPTLLDILDLLIDQTQVQLS
ncbi:9728_t:CDS:1, partial [Racocetra fulgida]